MSSVCIEVNDIFSQLLSENTRLRNELSFANQCIRLLLKFKTYLDQICDNFGPNLDHKLAKELNQLQDNYQQVLTTRPAAPEDVKCEPKTVVRKRPNADKKYEFRCDWIGCHFVTNRNSRLRAHHNYHTGVRPFHCPHSGCAKAFVGRESLTTHVKAVHSSDRHVKCDILECVRRTRVTRKTTLKVLSDEKPFFCDVTQCTYRSKTRQALREHKLTHADRTLECPFDDCHKLFKNKKQLKNHFQTHSLDPPHKCSAPGCAAAFRTYKTLKMHRLKHLNQLPQFRCDWPGCDFTSVYNWILKRHNLIHTGEKPFLCSWPSCGARFRRSHYLKTHVLKHTGEKKFGCDWPQCDRRFQSKQSLSAHRKRHSASGDQWSAEDKCKE